MNAHLHAELSHARSAEFQRQAQHLATTPVKRRGVGSVSTRPLRRGFLHVPVRAAARA